MLHRSLMSDGVVPKVIDRVLFAIGRSHARVITIIFSPVFPLHQLGDRHWTKLAATVSQPGRAVQGFTELPELTLAGSPQPRHLPPGWRALLLQLTLGSANGVRGADRINGSAGMAGKRC